MTTEISQRGNQLPVDPKTGLTQPLRTFLGSQDLAKHRAMVAIELEVLAKKFDRFGWDREKGSAAHDRMITDWMDAMQDYPLVEVRDACRAHVLAEPGRMPNEGHIVARIIEARRKVVAEHKRKFPAVEAIEERRPVDRDLANRIMQEAGFNPRTFGGDE